jgi:hypothetical protein
LDTNFESLTSKTEAASILGIEVPSEFICPITLEVMSHPVKTPWGIHYDRKAAHAWLKNGSNTCPLTRRPLHKNDLVLDLVLKDKIEFWTWANHIPDARKKSKRAKVVEPSKQDETRIDRILIGEQRNIMRS